ncbi:ABC transporter substrate-binding protein [Nodosilinea sp. LEGE 07088]|uniref:ABC transporter substrate-binding protein n=1 Tax=Nodosilinea sp. LEGE 07088 TaxID=2777968 RepID=UPI001D135451|nr:ABC transporter substrate-binding protein [Nodosilinea sp. LEGE 07088]
MSPTPTPLPQAVSDSVEGCRTVEHELGETEICGQPEKIAVLSPHILDIVLALGAQPAAYAETVALGVEKFDNPAEQIPYLGDRITTQPVNLGDRKNPSLEKLTLLKPDLILSEDWLARDNYRLLSQIAPTMLFTDEKSGAQHWRNDIDGIAKALGREEAAEEVNAEYLRQLAAARQSLAPLVETFPKILILSVNSEMTDVAIAADSTVGYLLEEIGFQLVFPEPIATGEMRWLQTSPEILPTLDSDIAIVIGWNASELYNPEAKLKEKWNQTPVFREVPAAKINRIFFVDYQLWGSITRGPITDQLILEKLPEMLLPLLSNS